MPNHGEISQVSWLQNSFPMQQTDRHTITSRGNRHSLNIQLMQSEDFGNYRHVKISATQSRASSVYNLSMLLTAVWPITVLAVPKRTWKCPAVPDRLNSIRHRGAARQTATIWRGWCTVIRPCWRFDCCTENWWWVSIHGCATPFKRIDNCTLKWPSADERNVSAAGPMARCHSNASESRYQRQGVACHVHCAEVPAAKLGIRGNRAS